MARYLLTLDDCAKINRVVPPVAGCNSGEGIQLTIPRDWREQIAAGIPVEGCSYVLPDLDGTVEISDNLLTTLQRSPHPDAASVVGTIQRARPLTIKNPNTP